jgi:hypothetical protein
MDESEGCRTPAFFCRKIMKFSEMLTIHFQKLSTAPVTNVDNVDKICENAPHKGLQMV